MWIILSTISLLGYAAGDIFGQFATDQNGEHASAKITLNVALFYIFYSVCILLTHPEVLKTDLLQLCIDNWMLLIPFYLVGNLCFYRSIRYIPINLFSIIGDSSTIVTFLLTVAMFMLTGRKDVVSDFISPLKIVLIIIVFVGVVAISIIQNNADTSYLAATNPRRKKHAVLLGVILCLSYDFIDALDTVIDTYYLTNDLDIPSYYFLILLMAVFSSVVLYTYICCKEHKIYNPFKRTEKNCVLAGVVDAVATIAYVQAITYNALGLCIVITAISPVAIIMGRIFLKEKTPKRQWYFVILTIAALVMFTIADTLL